MSPERKLSLSKSMNCPWLKAEMCHNSATFGARSQARKGFNYGEVFGRIWFSKLCRIGFLADGNESGGESEVDVPSRKLSSAPRKTGANCTALITCYSMRKLARDAIRDVMLAHSIRTIFMIMQITKETLSGRTLGAEEPELAEKIMESEISDIEEPLEEKKDVIVIDNMQEVDAMFMEIKDGISRQLSAM